MRGPSILLGLAIGLTCTLAAHAHPGRTDASGGHHDRKNGGYHYHGGGSSPRPSYTPQPSYSPATESKPRPSVQKPRTSYKTEARTMARSEPRTKPWSGSTAVASSDSATIDEVLGTFLQRPAEDTIEPTVEEPVEQKPKLLARHRIQFKSGRTRDVADFRDDGDTYWVKGIDNSEIRYPKQMIAQIAAISRPAGDEFAARMSTLAPDVVTVAESILVGEVVAVTDGDTLTLLVDSTQHKIRLHGIDAPESGQPFGARAKQALAKITFGKAVAVHVVDTDRHGRKVSVVKAEDLNVNQALVRFGYAWWYEQYAPGDETLERYQAEAKAAGRGLWADPNPIPPWEWRKGE